VEEGNPVGVRFSPRAGLIAVIMAAALLAAACGGGGDSPVITEGAAPETTTPTGDAAPEPGPTTTGSTGATSNVAPSPVGSTSETREAVLVLDRETLDGSRLDLDALAGREVLLWFWAPW